MIKNKKEDFNRNDLLSVPIGTKIITNADNENYKTWIKINESEFGNVIEVMNEMSFKYKHTISYFGINNDLTLDTTYVGIYPEFGTKIIKIEIPKNTEVVYEDKIKEMTISQIEKILGYSIKIIEEGKK